MVSGRKAISLKKNWNTPKKQVDLAVSFFKEIGLNIELDPATNENSLVAAEIKFMLPIDGLKEEWNYKSIWLNPPYGIDKNRKTNLKKWIEKAYNTYIKYDNEILMLIPAVTNTSTFQNIIFNVKKGGMCFLKDTRLRFLDSDNNNNEDKKGSPIGICVVYFGKNYEIFEKIYSKSGKCFKINNKNENN
jgi:hypothetical protein